MSFGYPKSARLRRREEFNYVFSRGKKARGKYVKVSYMSHLLTGKLASALLLGKQAVVGAKQG